MPTNVTGLPQVVAGPTVGVEAASPPNITQHKIAPTTTDYYNFNTGDLWLQSVPTNTTPVAGTLRAWMLAAKNVNAQNQKTATWIPFFNGAAGALVSLTGNAGGAVFGDANQNINTVGDGVGITVTGVPGTHTLTWSLVGGGQAIQGLQPQYLSINNGAVVNPTLGIININNTDTNIVPTNGGGNTLNLNFADSIVVQHNITNGVGGLQSSISLNNYVNSANGGIISINKAHGSATSPVVPGDDMGIIQFTGYDGTNFIAGSSIASFASGTIAANRVAGNLVFSTHPDSPIALPSNPLQRMTISSTGQVVINPPDSGDSLIVNNGTGGNANENLQLFSTGNNANSTVMSLNKNRINAAIQSGDGLGSINFRGFDGTNYISGAVIVSVNNGTVAANRIGADLEFWTHPDAPAANPSQRMYITSAGSVNINIADAGSALVHTFISGGNVASAGDDGAGLASSTGFTNVTNTTQGAGTLSIKSTNANSGNNAGFIKIYVGTSVAYIPYFTNIAP